MKINILYWSENLDLVFSQELLKENNIKCHRFSHHKSWINRSRARYIKNFIFLIIQIFRIIYKCRRSRMVFFGSNLVRFFFFLRFFFKESYWVYNELQTGHYPKWLQSYDKYIFQRLYCNIYVSSKPRAEKLKELFNLDYTPLVLLNSTVGVWKPVSELVRYDDRLIFAGSIGVTRFSDTVLLNKLEKLKFNIDLYGPISGKMDWLVKHASTKYHGIVSRKKLLVLLKSYNFALLTYQARDLNNRYCAPVKVYEYIEAGCVVVFWPVNPGTADLQLQYPELFVSLDDLSTYCFDFDKYSIERNAFLILGKNNNLKFRDRVLDNN